VYTALDSGAAVKEVRPKIEAIAKQFPGAKVNDVSGLKQQFETQINQILGLVFALLFLAIFIALLGIMNTLLLSIVERTREIGLLRAVGMTRKQVRTSVRWESIIVAVFGALLGLVLGIFFGWAMVTALHDQGFTQLSVPVVQLPNPGQRLVSRAFARRGPSGSTPLLPAMQGALTSLRKYLAAHPGQKGALVLGLAVVAVAAGIAFVLRQRRAAVPLYDLQIAGRRIFWVAACAGIIVFGTLMGAMFIGQQFLQNVLGYSTLASGTAILPAAVIMVVQRPMRVTAFPTSGACSRAYTSSMDWLRCPVCRMIA
jgi:hypothetical protein